MKPSISFCSNCEVNKAGCLARGFTLIELMIVIVILGIIIGIAYPSYVEYVREAKRSVARSQLMEVYSRQEQFFINNKGYSTNLTGLGYGANPFYVDDQGLESVAGNSVYLIQLAAGASTSEFTLQAVPQNTQAADSYCGTFTLTNTGAQGASGSDCW